MLEHAALPLYTFCEVNAEHVIVEPVGAHVSLPSHRKTLLITPRRRAAGAWVGSVNVEWSQVRQMIGQLIIVECPGKKNAR